MPAWIGGILQVCVVSGASKSRISRELRAWLEIRRSNSEIRPAATARQRGEKKAEVRNQSAWPGCTPYTDLNAGKRAGIPKGFCNKAQGCEERATLGNLGRPPLSA